MRSRLARLLSMIVSASFAALALSAATAPTANATGKVTKEYCKTHKDDPRCKDMDKR
jgi:Ni/Co efflux regulator RcnB